jgi:hypothetical protein
MQTLSRFLLRYFHSIHKVGCQFARRIQLEGPSKMTANPPNATTVLSASQQTSHRIRYSWESSRTRHKSAPLHLITLRLPRGEIDNSIHTRKHVPSAKPAISDTLEGRKRHEPFTRDLRLFWGRQICILRIDSLRGVATIAYRATLIYPPSPQRPLSQWRNQ